MHRITNRGREEAKQIVDRYTGPVFTDKVRKMKMAAVKLKYMAGFKVVQPAHYPVPYHYQERLATRLLHPQHLDGIWIGLMHYRLPYAPP